MEFVLKDSCCKLIKCKNFKYCYEIEMKQIFEKTNGIYMICILQMGKYEKCNKIIKCCVCYNQDNKNIIF